MKKLFKVNDDYVIANNYQEAIEIWLRYYNKTLSMEEDDVKSIELVKSFVIVED